MQSYRELAVYQKSYEQVLRVYTLSKGFPREELYALQNQLKRAAVSIPLNIAEGYGKVEMSKELLRYLSMARGSSAEMEVLLELSKDLGFITEEGYREAIAAQQEVGKMLTGLIKCIREREEHQRTRSAMKPQ